VNDILRGLKAIARQVRLFKMPSLNVISRRKDPYLVLVSCILSLRTKDKTTLQASYRLFKSASDPGAMLGLSRKSIERLIYPVGFYHNKAKVILGLSKRILDDFKGKVPRTHEELLSLKGVGRKTANLVLGLGYGIPAICVDTHVHRISNRMGWVSTRDPEETEAALRKIIPEKYWIDLNTILVTFGQNLCLPVSPYCSQCGANKFCRRRGVNKSR